MNPSSYKPNHTHTSSFYVPTPTHSCKQRPPRSHLSLDHKIHSKLNLSLLQLDNEECPEIYFDKNRRKTFLKRVIDGYFHTPAPITFLDKTFQKNSTPISSHSHTRKSVYSSQSGRRNASSKPSENRATKKKAALLNLSDVKDIDRLPTICEGQYQVRPFSEYRPERKALASPCLGSDAEESLFSSSSKSIFQSKILTSDIEVKVNISKSNSRKSSNCIRTFKGSDDQQLIRERLIKKIGYTMMWNPSFKSTTLCYPYSKSLRQMCYNLVQDKKGQQALFLIFPTDYYYLLFANNCEQLIDIITSVAKIIANGKGLVSNNQVNPQNIHKITEKNFNLYDWGSAAVKEILQIQGQKLPTLTNPYCRSNDHWLVAPQYLAPEMLRAVQYDAFEHLWGQKGGVGSCDIWSLGCLLFQLVTLVPLWQSNPCIVKGSSHSRRGLLGTKVRTVQNILVKQKYFKSFAMRRLKEMQRQKGGVVLIPKLLQLLPRLLQESPTNRITAEEIISILS